MIKVLVVDDHEIMRRGLSLVFELSEDFELVGEACDGDEACKKVETTDPDVVLMDLRMPGKDGIQASREIKRRWPRTKIMVLTAIDDEDDIVIAIEAGVDGYMLKNVSGDELTDAVRLIAGGQMYLHPLVARKALSGRPGCPACRANMEQHLTVCESRVLGLMAEGLKNKEIAAKLYLSEETVKSHISHILTKLDQTDRMQAVLYALRHNLVCLDPSAERKADTDIKENPPNGGCKPLWPVI